MPKQLFKKQKAQFAIFMEHIDSEGNLIGYKNLDNKPIGARIPLTAVKEAINTLRKHSPDFTTTTHIGDKFHITVERVK